MKPLKQQLFEENKSPGFIETGTNKGEGVELALKVGYSMVFSIEHNNSLFIEAFKKFEDDQRVTLLNGDSAKRLCTFIAPNSEQRTFWLDAHDAEKGECAILGELDAIAHYELKTHTIMIDDWEDFDTPKHGGITKASVIEALRRINPDYKIACYYAELGAPNILVAKV